MDRELHLNVPFHKTGELDGCLTQLGNLEGDTCHVLVNAPGVQVHEVRKVGPDEHPVILCLGHGVPREAKCPQVLEPPQVDDLGRRGEKTHFRGCCRAENTPRSLYLWYSVRICSLAIEPSALSGVTGEEGLGVLSWMTVLRPWARPGLSKESADLGSNASCGTSYPLYVSLNSLTCKMGIEMLCVL